MPNEPRDLVQEARELLSRPIAFRLTENAEQIIRHLCDEVEQLRRQADEDKAAFDELMELWKKAVGAR